ncbi:MAG: VOC family protein [Peptococcaceae bacterium]|nr:VOC family protein [Peptococcaceae bacterium]
MQFTFLHNNFNVTNLENSLAFYDQALGLKEVSRIESEDGSFIIVYLGDGVTKHKLELTWLRDHPQPYDLGENEFHLALEADDFAYAYSMHKALGCVVFENPEMGIYFIADPDNYWIEILPPADED